MIKEIVILIVWVDRTEPTIGGLQKRISEISFAVARAGYKVVIVTLEGSHSSENPFVEKVDSLETGYQVIASLVDKSPNCVIYVGRLISPETEHVRQLALLAKLGATILVRAQSTRAAEILSLPRCSRLLAPCVTSIHALNQESAKLLRMAYAETQVKLIPNPFPRNLFVGGWPRDSYAMFAGRIVPSKNLHSLIYAWRLLSCSKTQLRIYGISDDVSYYEYCKKLTKDCESIKWYHPYKPNNFTPLSRARFLVVPSLREGHSNLVSEAMSVGTFILGSRVSGIAEHINNGRGMCVEPSSGDIFKGLRAVSVMQDDELMRCASAAKSYADQHTTDLQLLDLLRQLRT